MSHYCPECGGRVTRGGQTYDKRSRAIGRPVADSIWGAIMFCFKLAVILIAGLFCIIAFSSGG